MNEPLTLDFDAFWNWLVTHPNCVLRAGTPEAVLYDDEEYHWHFAMEGSETLLVQVLRGKRLVGELLLAPEQIAYVQGTPGDQEGEYVFELISENETDRASLYFFILAHGYDDEQLPRGRVH